MANVLHLLACPHDVDVFTLRLAGNDLIPLDTLLEVRQLLRHYPPAAVARSLEEACTQMVALNLIPEDEDLSIMNAYVEIVVGLSQLAKFTTHPLPAAA